MNLLAVNRKHVAVLRLYRGGSNDSAGCPQVWHTGFCGNPHEGRGVRNPSQIEKHLFCIGNCRMVLPCYEKDVLIGRHDASWPIDSCTGKFLGNVNPIRRIDLRISIDFQGVRGSQFGCPLFIGHWWQPFTNSHHGKTWISNKRCVNTWRQGLLWPRSALQYDITFRQKFRACEAHFQ